MVTKQEKSSFSPTSYPAAGFAPGKSKNLLVLMGSLRGTGLFFDVGSHSHEVQNEKQASALTTWRSLLPTHPVEARIHLRTKLWSQAEVWLYSLCLSRSHLTIWPQMVWRQEVSFNLMPRRFLAVSNTERLGSLYPQAKEPTVSFRIDGMAILFMFCI